jgi:sugar phosphate isomerase/epimerase
MTRRKFIGKSAMAAGAAALACQETMPLNAEPLGMPIGFQVYPVRDLLAKDFEGTLKRIAALGYQSVEMCSPPGYVDSGFGPLAKLKASEMREIIHKAGLHCESCHYSFQELQKSLDERMAYAKELGLTQMIASGFWLKPDATLSDWLKASEELNALGERTKKEGIQLGFHNHHFEFKELEGVLIYDAIMGKLDPDLIKMQFQVAVVNIGYQAATYFKKYPGRFISLHLADWSATEKKGVPIGKGVVDWKNLFTAAKLGGVKNYFVEMDLDAFKPSSEYLRDLKV